MIAPRSADPECEKDASQPHRRVAFTLIEFVFMFAVAFVVLALLVALFLPSVGRGREAARRTQCKNNLKQIGLALHNYHDVYGAFPPAYTVDADGKPLHSWRTLILPYLDQGPLYNKINLSKGWDDPVNADALKTRLPVYSCPSDPAPGDSQSMYLAVVTSNSAFCATQPRKISEISDGTSNTLMVIEVPHDQAVPWMAPQDANEALIASVGPDTKGLHHTGGRHALLADGAVRFLSQNIAPATLLALCSATGGETVGEF